MSKIEAKGLDCVLVMEGGMGRRYTCETEDEAIKTAEQMAKDLGGKK